MNRCQKLLCINSFYTGLGESALFFLPLYAAYLGATPIQVGFVLASNVFILPLIIFSSTLIKHANPRTVTIGGWIVATFAICTMGIAPNWYWLVLSTALYQLSYLNAPAVRMYEVLASTDEEDLTRLLSLRATVYAIGMLVTPGIAGLIASNWGLRAVYYMATLMYILGTLALYFTKNHGRLPSSQVTGRLPVSSWAVLSFVFLACFSVKIGQDFLPQILETQKGGFNQVGLFGIVSAIGVICTNGLVSLRYKSIHLIHLPFFLVVIGLTLFSSGNPLLAAFFLGGKRVLQPILTAEIGHLYKEESATMYVFYEGTKQTAFALAGITAGWLYGLYSYFPIYIGLILTALCLLLSKTMIRRNKKCVTYSWTQVT
ncbi:MAG: MFS transporter [Anaerolineae bacterium]|nr:MFS transporter [Anaerolineae bacterium]